VDIIIGLLGSAITVILLPFIALAISSTALAPFFTPSSAWVKAEGPLK